MDESGSRVTEPWLAHIPNLYVLLRMAIMADFASVKLLLKLTGHDVEMEVQIIQATGGQAAVKACAAARSAYLRCMRLERELN